MVPRQPPLVIAEIATRRREYAIVASAKQILD